MQLFSCLIALEMYSKHDELSLYATLNINFLNVDNKECCPELILRVDVSSSMTIFNRPEGIILA